MNQLVDQNLKKKLRCYITQKYLLR